MCRSVFSLKAVRGALQHLPDMQRGPFTQCSTEFQGQVEQFRNHIMCDNRIVIINGYNDIEIKRDEFNNCFVCIDNFNVKCLVIFFN